LLLLLYYLLLHKSPVSNSTSYVPYARAYYTRNKLAWRPLVLNCNYNVRIKLFLQLGLQLRERLTYSTAYIGISYYTVSWSLGFYIPITPHLTTSNTSYYYIAYISIKIIELIGNRTQLFFVFGSSAINIILDGQLYTNLNTFNQQNKYWRAKVNRGRSFTNLKAFVGVVVSRWLTHLSNHRGNGNLNQPFFITFSRNVPDNLRKECHRTHETKYSACIYNILYSYYYSNWFYVKLVDWNWFYQYLPTYLKNNVI